MFLKTLDPALTFQHFQNAETRNFITVCRGWSLRLHQDVRRNFQKHANQSLKFFFAPSASNQTWSHSCRQMRRKVRLQVKSFLAKNSPKHMDRNGLNVRSGWTGGEEMMMLIITRKKGGERPPLPWSRRQRGFLRHHAVLLPDLRRIYITVPTRWTFTCLRFLISAPHPFNCSSCILLFYHKKRWNML